MGRKLGPISFGIGRGSHIVTDWLRLRLHIRGTQMSAAAPNGSAQPPNGSAKPLCFGIGSIGGDGTEARRHADFLLRGLARHVLEAPEFGYTVKRADEETDPGMINNRVISDIRNADLVVADMTDLNPNAFYELGICHSAEKPVIHIAKAATPLPFDNAAHRAIFVDVSDWDSLESARTRLAASARKIKEPGYQVSNPITQANASFKMRDNADPNEQVIADLQARLATMESEMRALTKVSAPQNALLSLQRLLARHEQPAVAGNALKLVSTGDDGILRIISAGNGIVADPPRNGL
jgi:hypothetical protein